MVFDLWNRNVLVGTCGTGNTLVQLWYGISSINCKQLVLTVTISVPLADFQLTAFTPAGANEQQ